MTDGKNDKPADTKGKPEPNPPQAGKPGSTDTAKAEEKPAATQTQGGKPATRPEPKVGAGKPEDAKAESGKPESGKPQPGKSEPARPGAGGKPPAGGPSAKPASGGAGKGGGAALVLAILVAVAAAVGGWYLWQQLQQLQQRQAALPEAGQLESLRTQLDQEQQARQALEQQLAQAGEQAAQSQRRAAQAADDLGALRQEQERIQSRLNRIADLADTSRDEWIRSEAAYLANIAVHRLRFHGDVDAALGALQAADNLLAELGAQSLGKRRAIKQAVDRLMAVQLPNYERVGDQLEALMDVVPQLPLAAERLRDVAEQQPEQQAQPLPEDAGWQARLSRAWDRFTDSLGELVVLEPDQGAMPLVAPSERFYLRQNLTLRLEAARLAMAQNDAELYRNSLQRAEGWVQTYFDQDAPAVVATLEELRQLQRVDVDPALPDISDLLEPLKMFD